MPSTRVAATWHIDTAIEPMARRRPVTWTSASLEAASQRGSADSMATISRRPSRLRRSGGAGASGAPLSRTPLPRVAHHSSPGPRS
jgi:hypothetical protein